MNVFFLLAHTNSFSKDLSPRKFMVWYLQQESFKFNEEVAWLSGQSRGFECGRPGFKSPTGLLNEFVLGDPRCNISTLCK